MWNESMDKLLGHLADHDQLIEHVENMLDGQRHGVRVIEYTRHDDNLHVTLQEPGWDSSETENIPLVWLLMPLAPANSYMVARQKERKELLEALNKLTKLQQKAHRMAAAARLSATAFLAADHQIVGGDNMRLAAECEVQASLWDIAENIHNETILAVREKLRALGME